MLDKQKLWKLEAKLSLLNLNANTYILLILFYWQFFGFVIQHFSTAFLLWNANIISSRLVSYQLKWSKMLLQFRGENPCICDLSLFIWLFCKKNVSTGQHKITFLWLLIRNVGSQIYVENEYKGKENNMNTFITFTIFQIGIKIKSLKYNIWSISVCVCVYIYFVKLSYLFIYQ